MTTMKNSVSLIGYLGSDVQCLALSTGRKVARVSLATNEYYRDKTGERTKRTEWHNLAAWGSVAERMERDLVKGMRIVIDGKLVHRSYSDKNGKKRYLSEIIVASFLKPAPTQATAA
jgi:single-strand DNA-binding protein